VSSQTVNPQIGFQFFSDHFVSLKALHNFSWSYYERS